MINSNVETIYFDSKTSRLTEDSSSQLATVGDWYAAIEEFGYILVESDKIRLAEGLYLMDENQDIFRELSS